jgi:hypothetical protein
MESLHTMEEYDSIVKNNELWFLWWHLADYIRFTNMGLIKICFFPLIEQLKAYYPEEFVFQNLHLGSNTTGNVERKPYCFLIKTPMYLFT